MQFCLIYVSTWKRSSTKSSFILERRGEECVNIEMGRTPTDSESLRQVIMHNHNSWEDDDEDEEDDDDDDGK